MVNAPTALAQREEAHAQTRPVPKKQIAFICGQLCGFPPHLFQVRVAPMVSTCIVTSLRKRQEPITSNSNTETVLAITHRPLLLWNLFLSPFPAESSRLLIHLKFSILVPHIKPRTHKPVSHHGNRPATSNRLLCEYIHVDGRHIPYHP